MRPPPPCRSLGRQCAALDVTLRVAHLNDGPLSGDHEATWLLGHTQRLAFDRLRRDGDHLYVDAVLVVPCRFFRNSQDRSSCTAHGFDGPMLPAVILEDQPRRLGVDRFRLVEQGGNVVRDIPMPPRQLPVMEGENPCHGAPCRTADNTRGSACCRDLQIEILCQRADTRLEALVRARKSPYLCKVDRATDDSLEAELISACGYLDDVGAGCTLHGRARPDGRPAKPDLCSDWPPKGKGIHPGCVFKGSGEPQDRASGQPAG
jgi:hypothetical protein